MGLNVLVKRGCVSSTALEIEETDDLPTVSGMIRAVLITYNDMPVIKRAVESVYDQVDEIIAVDGRFEDFPQVNHRDYSTDGTIEYLDSLEKVRLLIMPPRKEVDKRNLYLVGDVGDWYLHLDTDEEWIGKVTYNPDVDMMISPMKRYHVNQWMERIRLFKHTEGLHYNKKHYWLHDRYGKTYALLDRCGGGYKFDKHKGTKLIHYENERTPERVRDKRKYYKILVKEEGRIKEVI